MYLKFTGYKQWGKLITKKLVFLPLLELNVFELAFIFGLKYTYLEILYLVMLGRINVDLNIPEKMRRHNLPVLLLQLKGGGMALIGERIGLIARRCLV